MRGVRAYSVGGRMIPLGHNAGRGGEFHLQGPTVKTIPICQPGDMVLTDFHTPAMEFLEQGLRQTVVGTDTPMKIDGMPEHGAKLLFIPGVWMNSFRVQFALQA